MQRLLERHRLLGPPGRALVERAEDAGADARPRVELLDRRVGAVRDERAGLDQRAERVRAVELLRPEALGEVAVGRRVAELDGRGDPERGEAREIVLGEALGVLDPLAQPVRPPELLRPLERVERLAVRAVADRVHGDRPAGLRARRTISASSSPLVISTPQPSSIRAVCEPSVPSMNALR